MTWTKHKLHKNHKTKVTKHEHIKRQLLTFFWLHCNKNKEPEQKKNRENWEERQKFLMKKLNDKANSMNVGEENGGKETHNDD